MKIFATTISVLSLASTAKAFVSRDASPRSVPSTTTTTTSLGLFDASVADETTKSKSVPFVQQNKLLDGTYPGDVGFDPLFMAFNKELLIDYRDAEIKHARLAMLAALGWPASEVYDRFLAASWGLQPAVVDSTDRAPSVLNGGLGSIPTSYWVASLAVASFVECANLQKKRTNPDWYPGNLNFDPLGIMPKTEAGRREMELKEIKNGRLAMLAITAFAVQEFVQQQSVVDITPFLFKPPFF